MEHRFSWTIVLVVGYVLTQPSPHHCYSTVHACSLEWKWKNSVQLHLFIKSYSFFPWSTFLEESPSVTYVLLNSSPLTAPLAIHMSNTRTEKEKTNMWSTRKPDPAVLQFQLTDKKSKSSSREGGQQKPNSIYMYTANLSYPYLYILHTNVDSHLI